MGRAVLHPGLPGRAGDQALGGRALGAQAASGDGAVGVALDLGDAAVLDEDLLAAADGAVGADGLDDPVGVLGAGVDGVGAVRPDGGAEAEAVAVRELAHHGPLLEQAPQLRHGRSVCPLSQAVGRLSIVALRTRLSIEEFLRGDWPPGAQLIDGEVIVNDPTLRHQRVCKRILVAIELWSRAG